MELCKRQFSSSCFFYNVFVQIELIKLSRILVGMIIALYKCIDHCYSDKEEGIMRISEHPILGEPKKGEKVNFYYNGKEVEGYEGEPIAAALMNAGVWAHRYTRKKKEPRGIFCAIGRCTDCVMVVDGEINVRTCITPLRAGMKVETQVGLAAIQENSL